MAKYGVDHIKALAYHPQSNRQAEITNREIKRILEKTVSADKKDWAMRLDESHWAYRTMYKVEWDKSRVMCQRIKETSVHVPRQLKDKPQPRQTPVIWAILA